MQTREKTAIPAEGSSLSINGAGKSESGALSLPDPAPLPLPAPPLPALPLTKASAPMLNNPDKSDLEMPAKMDDGVVVTLEAGLEDAVDGKLERLEKLEGELEEEDVKVAKREREEFFGDVGKDVMVALNWGGDELGW